MKTSTKDKIKGNFHEVKGTIKEEIGKVTNDRNLKAEGKAEKKAGKVQQRIGDAKEGVAKLKGQLAELKSKRPVGLSITHKFSAKGEAQLDVGQAGQASPYDRVSGGCVAGTREIAPESRDLDQVS